MSDRVVDQELVERVQAGDKRAFDLLVLKYQRKVQRLVSRFVRDSGEVDDVVQEAFIKAYRALPTFRGDAAFYTWIYRIAINCAKNYLASPGRRIVPMSDLISDDDDDAESFDRNEGLHDVATPDAEYAPRILFDAMSTHPEMVSGEGRNDLALAQAGRGDWANKVGADGVQTLACRSRGIGIAAKVSDGDIKALMVAFCDVLEQLGMLDDTARAALASWAGVSIKSVRGIEVGRLQPHVLLRR